MHIVALRFKFYPGLLGLFVLGIIVISLAFPGRAIILQACCLYLLLKDKIQAAFEGMKVTWLFFFFFTFN